jgi:glycosyltransferase involved in cell wall biosynthesis
MSTQSLKKIVIVVNNLNVGGVCSLVSQLTRDPSSGKYRYEIVNLGKSEDSAFLEQIKSLQIPVHQVNYSYVPGYSVIAYFRKAFFKRRFLEHNVNVIDKLIELKPDILHFHTLPHELLLGQEVSKKCDCVLVYTDHTRRIDPSEINPVSRALIKFPFQEFYRGYNVIAVSESVMTYLKEVEIDKTAKSVKLIVNKIVDTDKRINYEKKSELKVVYVARITEGKGHADLLNAWKTLPPLQLHLYLIGPEDINVRTLINENELNNKITFTGSRSDVKNFIGDADLGVFPSYKEGLPLALLEKMQLGIPCVVSNIKELTSIVENNVNGLVYDLGRVADLATDIMHLVKDPERRRALGTRAAALVKEKYVSRLGGINKEYELYYDELLERK